MTTNLYPNDRFGDITNYNLEKDAELEKSWLIEEIVKPELPNIIDNVEKCLEMLESNQIFKIPITSGSEMVNSPSIRGILARQGGYILDFQAVVKFPEFNKGKQTGFRMNSGRKLPLYQLNNIMVNLQQILTSLEDIEMIKDVTIFIKTMGNVLELLTQSINLLQNPPRGLAFPENSNNAMKEMFQDYSTLSETPQHELSLELLLFKNEISIDFRNLIKVTKKPWCDIDPETGKSFTDKIKDKLKADRSKNLADVLKNFGIQIEEHSLFNNLIISAFNTEKTTLVQAQNYLSRCITFNNKVVMEAEKLAITTSDPSLISLSSKLNSLENSISNYYTNLNV